jgi:hypothetical protein
MMIVDIEWTSQEKIPSCPFYISARLLSDEDRGCGNWSVRIHKEGDKYIAQFLVKQDVVDDFEMFNGPNKLGFAKIVEIIDDST